MWFLAGFLLVRYFRGVCLTVLIFASLAFVGYSPLGWLPFVAVIGGWWWLRRSRLRRVARQGQAIADEQYRLMQLQAEFNAHALARTGRIPALAVSGHAAPAVDGSGLTQPCRCHPAGVNS